MKLHQMILAAPAVVLFSMGAAPGTAIAAPAKLAGNWSGGGHIKFGENPRERVRCKVRFSKQSDKVYSVSAICASKSGKINQTGTVLKVNNSRYVGDFYNSQFDVAGRIRVTVNGNRQTVNMSSGSGSGKLTLKKR